MNSDLLLATGMKSTIGIPARAGNFLERRAETRELLHRATRGHVLMLAPRRVGKTSLLYHLRDVPPQGWRCLLLSVEALASEAQFVARLLAALYEAQPSGGWLAHFGGSVRTALKNVDKIGLGPVYFRLAQAVGEDWQAVGTTTLGVMKGLRNDTLVLVDEFPIFVRRLLAGPEGEPRTRLFLGWFRETRNALGDDGRVHFVLSGSLGLDAVVRSVGMSATINDLATYRLGPLSDDLAHRLLQGLAEGEKLPLTAALRKRMRSHVDWPIPFHLQLIFAEVLNRVKFRGRALDEGLVDEAYAALLSPRNRSHFEHWVERLDEPVLAPEERDLKRALLRAAARDPNGLADSSIVQIRKKVAPDIAEEVILATLEHDGYLTRQGDRWRFASSLLRDWWLKWQMKSKSKI